MVTIELTPDEATFLIEQLRQQHTHVEEELARAGDRSQKSELERELERLDRLRGFVERRVEAEASPMTW